MEAIILAGGLGTRLRGVVPDLPKPLAPVAGRPFLAWLLAQLADGGVRRAVLSVGFRGERIERAFGDSFGAMTLAYVYEAEPLGTGGALRLALAATADDDVLVLNGDSFATYAPDALMAAHRAAGRPLTLVLAEVDDVGRYGEVRVAGGSVAAFAEKGGCGPGLINAGVYAVARSLLADPALPARFSFESDFLMPRVAALRPAAVVSRGLFIDIGVPDDYARAQQLFATRQ